MATRTFTFNVVAPATTALQSLANQVASGSWSTLAQAATINSTIGDSVGNNGEATGPLQVFRNWMPSSYVVLDWCGKAHTDGTDWWYAAGGTGGVPSGFVIVRYNVATNTWRHWTAPSVGDGTPTFTGQFGIYGRPHDFQMTAMDPATKKLWCVLRDYPGYWNGSTEIQGAPLDYNPIGIFRTQGTPGAEGVLLNTGFETAGTYKAFEIFPDMGTAGALIGIGVQTPTDGRSAIIRRDIAAPNTVTQLAFETPSANPAVICYCNGAMYYATGTTAFKKIAANGTITTMAQPLPVAMASTSNGNPALHSIWLARGTYIYAFCGYQTSVGSIYRFNTATPTAPWETVGTMNPSGGLGTGHTIGYMPQQDVFLFVRYTGGDSSGTALIWKP